MKCFVPGKLVFEAEPECGVDFCEQCGDCLACCGEDECYSEGKHDWVMDDEEEARRRFATEIEQLGACAIPGFREMVDYIAKEIDAEEAEKQDA